MFANGMNVPVLLTNKEEIK